MKCRLIKKLLLLLISSFVLWACEKDITLDIPTPEEKVVVEGWIEQDQPAVVMLTKNSGYFAVINSETLQNMLVTDAIVRLKEVETGIEEVLTLVFNPLSFPPFQYKGNTILGKVNHTYALQVELSNNKVLNAVTTIPSIVAMDSVWFEADVRYDTLGQLVVKFQDPAALGNYYRVFTKRIPQDSRFVPVFGSVYDDIFFNGQMVEYAFYRGIDRFVPENEDEGFERFFFKLGDTVIAKVSSIDQAHFKFWQSYEYAIYSGGNPFASPITLNSNIEGGLGVWGGYAAYYDTIVAGN